MSVEGNPDTVSTPDTEGHTLTLEQALELAVILHRSGETATAEKIYRRILETVPDHPTTMHYLGVLHHATGRSADAVDLIRRAIALQSDDVGMHNNLGNVLAEIGRADEAAEAYLAAVTLEPDHIDALNNLGVTLRTLKRFGDAETVYRRVIALEPEYREAHDNLGRLLAGLGRTEEAVACHRRALELEPSNADTRRLLAHMLAMRGERDQALAVVDGWLAEEPASPRAQHLRASISGEGVPQRASDLYIETVFDAFAETFDRKLASLEYRAPELVAASVRAALGEPARDFDILDAGCGTGLCGPLVSPYARRLDGVDLSARMLDLARQRDVYDALAHEELTHCLQHRACAYDLILTADTLCYFGDLREVMCAARSALRPEGFLIFTLEEDTDGRPFVLNLHGRYTHGEAYVAAVLAEAGLRIAVLEREVLRRERGKPVPGLIVTARPAAEWNEASEPRPMA